MADWKDDKDKGSWDFNLQENKFGYLNNPDWVEGYTKNHLPCGYWHKGSLEFRDTEILELEAVVLSYYIWVITANTQQKLWK